MSENGEWNSRRKNSVFFRFAGFSDVLRRGVLRFVSLLACQDMQMGNLRPAVVETTTQGRVSELAKRDPQDWPVVSVIVPCRNEERFIGTCIDSLLASDYPSERLEVIIVDGTSEDRTRDVVESFSQKSPLVKLLQNPKKTMPAATNLAIRHAGGEIVMILGAHARVPRNYVSCCVDCLLTSRADNVGGVVETLPQRAGLVGNAIVATLSHRFGVGNGYFRIHTDHARWVDTVFGGCYRKEIFEKLGMFNELLVCTQDMEFNRRLKKSGGKILLVPHIICYYYARSDLKSFWRHNLRNGKWAILPFAYSDVTPVGMRHLVPLVFLTSLVGSAILAMWVNFFLWVLMAILGTYSVASLAASQQIAWRKRDFRYLFLMPMLFSMLHVGYGLGSAWGMVRALQVRLSRLASPAQDTCRSTNT